MTNSPVSDAFNQLVDIMSQLRTPVTGCPWDLEQDFSTIAPYAIEEAYEVVDAIENKNYPDLRDELGDLLLQVVFHAQMAKELSYFTIEDVILSISEKMIRRHPHVFEVSEQRNTDEQALAWEDIKAQERIDKANHNNSATSALDGVALALPALLRAEKLQKRAARVGFDWTNPEDIFDKLEEEKNEVREAVAIADSDKIEEELGDLLFVCANLARRYKTDPEVALRKANSKFERRFKAMEALSSKEGAEFSSLTLEEQEQLWQMVKRQEVVKS